MGNCKITKPENFNCISRTHFIPDIANIPAFTGSSLSLSDICRVTEASVIYQMSAKPKILGEKLIIQTGCVLLTGSPDISVPCTGEWAKDFIKSSERCRAPTGGGQLGCACIADSSLGTTGKRPDPVRGNLNYVAPPAICCIRQAIIKSSDNPNMLNVGRCAVTKEPLFPPDPVACALYTPPDSDYRIDQYITCDPEDQNYNLHCSNTVVGYCIEGRDWPSDPPNSKTTRKNWNRTTGGVNLTPSQFTSIGGICDIFLNQLRASGKTENNKSVSANFVQRMANRHFKVDGVSPNAGMETANGKFNTLIYDNCLAEQGGTCKVQLTDACKIFTRQDVADNLDNTTFHNLCGCHLPQDEYDKFDSTGLITRECDPLCTPTEVLKPKDADCTQTNCVINNVTISIQESDLGGGISFTQICPGCTADNNGDYGSSTCSCYIGDITISGYNSDIAGDIKLEQVCGTCFELPPDGNAANAKEVSCSDGSAAGSTGAAGDINNISEQLSKNKKLFLGIVIGIIILLVIIVIIVTLVKKSSNKFKLKSQNNIVI